jgi:gamma-glutamyltranspeptidase
VARRTKPGARLPDPCAPVAVLKDGKPFGAFSTIGAGLHERLTSVLFDVLEFNKTPQQALNQPSLGSTIRFWFIGRNRQTIGSGKLDPRVTEGVKALGLNLVYDPTLSGYVVGITIDPKTQLRHGGTIEKLGGRAVGF